MSKQCDAIIVTNILLHSQHDCYGAFVKALFSQYTNSGCCYCFQGKQEDAEEFLGSILDGLHEEMVEAKKAANPLEGDTDSSTAGEGSL